MLEQLRQNSRSFIIWILFGIIIAVFIISFGPQAKGDSLACGGYSSEEALEVGGKEVSLNSWRFAVNGLKGGGPSPIEMRRQQAVDFLVERELLAQAAEQQGFRVSSDTVNQSIGAGEFFILGHLIRMQDPSFWRDFQQLESFANSFGLANVAALAEEQRRELMADMMRQLLVRSATVSEEEARQVYIQQNTKVTADYVKFEARTYRNALQLGEADIDRYVAGHDAELKKAWETEKTQWASERPRVLARHILIAKDTATTKEEARPAQGKPGEPTPGAAKPGPATPGQDKSGPGKTDGAAVGDKAPAQQRAERIRARLASGADFAAVAREVSDDRQTRARGGLLGWRPADSLGYGKEVVEAAKKLSPGQISAVIESERGYHIIKIEERSDKALTYEQKRSDLAARLAPDYYARALARRDAEKALAEARQKPLEQLFERKAAPPSPAMPQNLPPEVLEQLEQLRREGIDVHAPPAGGPAGGEDDSQGGAGGSGEGEEDGKQGRLIVREGPTMLAQSAGAPPPAKPGAAATTPATPAELPTITVDRPPLESVGPTSRMGDFVAGIGRSEKLVTDLFEKLEVGKVAPDVYEVDDAGGDGFAIVMLKAREQADLGKFADSRARIIEQMTQEKGVVRLSDWVRQRCEETSKSGAIKVNRKLFEEGEGEARPGYQPCMTLSALSASRQLATAFRQD